MGDINKRYDVVVIGGGISGVCAAIAAARRGALTALIQDRPVLGGNASSEVRVQISGADRDGAEGRKNYRETGIILEILLRNKALNGGYSFSVFDNVLWDMVKQESRLDLYLNTTVYAISKENNKIFAVRAVQLGNEKKYYFQGKFFVDTTGDAALVALCDGEAREGREAKREYMESLAPENSDNYTMGSTIMFSTKDMGRKVSYKKPDWAYTITKKKLGKRAIHNLNFGYWWIEVGGDELRTIQDNEEIRDELIKYVYGIFDYIKNSGEYEADTLALDWIAPIPGKRESRRSIGDYVLTQNDIETQARFKDTVAYGGWTMDMHSVGGIRNQHNEKEEGTVWNQFKGIYAIPYRCLYNKDVDNLYVGGRAISATHIALSSTRVMATCGVIGQAIGTAAALAVKKDFSSAREIGTNIEVLQQMLIEDDCYLPGICVIDEKDIIRNQECYISASSEVMGGEAQKICTEYARTIGGESNCWIARGVSEEWIKIELKAVHKISRIRIRFDPDLNQILIPTMELENIMRQPTSMPKTLIKDYDLFLLNKEQLIEEKKIRNNILRVNEIKLDGKNDCDEIKIVIKSNYGDKHARIFEIQVYD